jgi:hypothetical protein
MHHFLQFKKFARIALLMLATVDTTSKADDTLIKFTASVTVADQQYNTPSFTSKSGQPGKVTYPVLDKGSGQTLDVVITATSTLEKALLNYDITASIPVASGKLIELSTKGTTDAGKPITYRCENDGKSYGFDIVLLLVNVPQNVTVRGYGLDLPATVPFKEGMTAFQALDAAGAFDNSWWDGEVSYINLIRADKTIKVNWKAVRKNQTVGPTLQPGDIVEISESFW